MSGLHIFNFDYTLSVLVHILSKNPVHFENFELRAYSNMKKCSDLPLEEIPVIFRAIFGFLSNCNPYLKIKLLLKQKHSYNKGLLKPLSLVFTQDTVAVPV